MHTPATIFWFRSCLILVLILISFSAAFSQESQTVKELDEAIANAKNGKYEQAIPVLKKYANAKGLDDFKTLSANIYLNLCYLSTKNEALDVGKVSDLTDAYIAKFGISKNDSLRSVEEMKLLYIAGIINSKLSKNEKTGSYLLLIKQHYESKRLKGDQFYCDVLYVLTLGYFNLSDYKAVTEVGQIALKVNCDLFGEKNEDSLKLLDMIYSAYYQNNEFKKAIEYLQKRIIIGKELLGDRNPDYLSSLNSLAIIYSHLGDYSKVLEIHLKVLELRKEVLGEKHPDYFQSLANLTYAYSKLGDYQKALENGLKVVALGKEILGEKHPDYLTILSNLATVYSDLGNYQKALEVNLKVVELRKEVLGEKHPDYLTSLNNLALDYSYLGDYKKSLEITLKVVDLEKEILGEKHPDYLISLSNLASAYSDIGKYPKALEINLKIIELRKEVLGEKHPDYLNSLSNLAFNYSDLGDYQKSLEINLKIVEIRKEVLGEKHPDFLNSLSNLAFNYSSLGDYQKSLEINLKEVELRKEIFGEKHPDYFTSLNNLAAIYSNLGDFTKALEIDLKVADLKKEILGEKHPDYLIGLSNLASAYSDLGDYQKSLEINLRVINLRKEVLGEKHPSYLNSLNNLATDYKYLHDYKKSMEINFEVVELCKEVFGDKHPDYLRSLNNLASAYSDLGNFQKSLEINLKIVDLRKVVLGERHPDYLRSLNNLALVYSDLGEYEKSLELELKVVALRNELFGDNHPEYLKSLINLAVIEFDLSEYSSALSHIQQMLNKLQERVIEYFSLITEYQREQFWKQYSRSYALFPMFLEKETNNKPEGAGDAYNISLFSKGLLLNTTLDFDKLIAENGTRNALAKIEELKLLKLQIQRILEKPVSERYLNVDSLQDIAQKKETELVKLSKEYGDYTRNLKIKWQDVQANLKDKDVAIEFVEYPTLTDTVKYAALVLRKGWQYPKMISLFRKDQIQEYIKLDKDLIYSNRFVGKQIKKLVWDPIEAVVSPGDRIYFSAAGIIHQLAVENLPANDSLTFGDLYDMHRLSSTKELVVQQKKDENITAVLYGGLQYDMPEDKMVAESKKYKNQENLYAIRGYSTDTSVRKGWNYLPGTLSEVNQIDHLMAGKHYQVSEYTGETGNEESFKSLSGKKKGIIHIATHGFFLPIEESRKNLFVQMRMGDQPERGGVDPMLRSGLMLSGGNRAWQGDKIPESIEDGVLTAKEISRMDLRGTNLVVLSACETGLGEVSSEGVFGLQRSFKQAGVQTLLMSLWEVSDQATSFMMTEFYSSLLSGKDMRAAFLEAKRKCKKKFPQPQYWAAFIMLD